MESYERFILFTFNIQSHIGRLYIVSLVYNLKIWTIRPFQKSCQTIIYVYIFLKVADEIWICEKQTVTKWEGDILSYKDHLKGKVMKESNKDAKNKGLDKNMRGNW